MTTIINKLNDTYNWWQNNKIKVYAGLEIISNALERLGRGIIRMALIGLILNLLTLHLYPSFSEEFPVIYNWFNGCLKLVELALKAALGGIYSIFTGSWSSFYESYSSEFYQLWTQFTSWLSTLF